MAFVCGLSLFVVCHCLWFVNVRPWQWLVLGGPGSVEGSIGWYMVVLGQYGAESLNWRRKINGSRHFFCWEICFSSLFVWDTFIVEGLVVFCCYFLLLRDLRGLQHIDEAILILPVPLASTGWPYLYQTRTSRNMGHCRRTVHRNGVKTLSIVISRNVWRISFHFPFLSGKWYMKSIARGGGRGLGRP